MSGPRNGARIDPLIERLDRLEAIEQIRQLASRYALALDSRDLDTLVGLYVDDVRVTRTERGRDAMRAVFDDALRTFRTSVHFVAEHVIDLDDDVAAERSPDHATGVVYCRAEHEVGDQWVVVPLQYVDAYERRDDQWYFRRRKILVWYETDVLTRPASALGQRRQWPGRAITAADCPNTTCPNTTCPCTSSAGAASTESVYIMRFRRRDDDGHDDGRPGTGPPART